MELATAPEREEREVFTETTGDKVRLNLGCNQNPQPGYINVDIEKFDGVDVVADLEKPWPWADDSVDEISFSDLPEHIRQSWDEPDPDLLEQAYKTSNIRTLIEAIKKPRRNYGIIHFMNEAYRVLKPGGILRGLIPSTTGNGWAQDPTHVSYWNENSFLYFTRAGGLHRLYPSQINARFEVVEIGTTKPNTLGITWVKVCLMKPAP